MYYRISKLPALPLTLKTYTVSAAHSKEEKRFIFGNKKTSIHIMDRFISLLCSLPVIHFCVTTFSAVLLAADMTSP